MQLIPGDAAAVMAGAQATATEIERVREQLGLDQPFLQQLTKWYIGLAQGDLGRSILLSRGVAEAMLERAPVTLSLTLAGLLIAVCVGMSLGVLSAVKQNTLTDQAAMTVALIGLSVPDFWVGLRDVLDPRMKVER